MSKIVVLASFYPKNEKNKEVKETIIAMVDPTRSEEGNEIYNFYEVKNDDGKNISFHLFESYKNPAALDFHRNTSHYNNYKSNSQFLYLLIAFDHEKNLGILVIE